MPTYHDGLADGRRFADTLKTASEGADAVRELFRTSRPSLADEAGNLRAEIAQEKEWRTLSRAAVAGLEAAIAQLPPEHRATFEAAMERTFDRVFVERARELGFVEGQQGQAAEVAATMRRSILGRLRPTGVRRAPSG